MASNQFKHCRGSVYQRHRKKQQIPIFGYFRVFKEYPQKSQSGNLVGNSLVGTCLTLLNLGFLWIFFKQPKISKNGNPLSFPVRRGVYLIIYNTKPAQQASKRVGDREKGKKGGPIEWLGAMSDCWRERCVQQARSQDALAFFLVPLNLRSRFTHHLLHTVMTFSIFKILPACYCSRRDFAQKEKSRGGTLVAPAGISPRGEIPRRHSSNQRVY